MINMQCIVNILYTILAVRKVGHLNIKINVFDFEACVLISWLENTLANEPIRTRASMSNIFVFMLRWPIFLTASISMYRSIENMVFFHSFITNKTQ